MNNNIKQISLFLILFLFPLFIYASGYKTDYINIDDYIHIETKEFNFNMGYRTNNKDKYFYIKHTNASNENAIYYLYVIDFFDKDKKYLESIKGVDRAATFTLNDIKLKKLVYIDDYAYYRLYLETAQLGDYYAPEENNTQLDKKKSKPIKAKVLVSNDNKLKNDYYYDKVNVDIDIHKIKEKVLIEATYNIDITANKDLDKIDIGIINNYVQDKNITILTKSNDIELNEKQITIKNIKKGNNHLSFKYSYEMDLLSTISFDVFRDNNVDSYINYEFNVKSNSNIDFSDRSLEVTNFNKVKTNKINDREYNIIMEASSNDLCYLVLKIDDKIIEEEKTYKTVVIVVDLLVLLLAISIVIITIIKKKKRFKTTIYEGIVEEKKEVKKTNKKKSNNKSKKSNKGRSRK